MTTKTIDMATGQRRITQILETCRDLFDRKLPATDTGVIQILLFLARGYNAAEAAAKLFELGYEMEAMGTGRTVGETAIEFAFITCDTADVENRLKLFYEHLAFRNYSESVALAKLKNTPATDPHLQATASCAKSRSAETPMMWASCDTWMSVSLADC